MVPLRTVFKLNEILNQLRGKNASFSKRLNEAEAVSRWDKAVGTNIAKHTRALRVEQSVLWVEVDHPIWKSELHHRKRQILEILNSGSQKAVLTDLFFVDPRR